MALWSQTIVDKFPSFVVGTAENSTLPRHANSSPSASRRRPTNKPCGALPPRRTVAYRLAAVAVSRNRPRRAPIKRQGEDAPLEFAALRIRMVDLRFTDRESHKRDDVEPGRRPISLLSVLRAENVRLRRAAVELRLHVKALREVLRRMEAPNAS